MNYESLLNIPYKTYTLFIGIILVSVITFIIILNTLVYDVYNTYAVFKDGNLILNVPITYSDTILNAEYYKLDKEQYDFKVLYVSEVLLDTTLMSNYQEVVISTDKMLVDNVIVNVSIYYNKEKVLEKIQENNVEQKQGGEPDGTGLSDKQ